MRVDRPVTQTAPLVKSKSQSDLSSVKSSPPKPSGPKPELFRSKSSSSLPKTLVSPELQDQIKDKIDHSSPQQVQANLESPGLQERLGKMELGKKLDGVLKHPVTQVVTKTGSGLSDLSEKQVSILGHEISGGDVLSSLEESSVERQLLSYTSGFSEDSIASFQGSLDTFMKTAKTASDFQKWWNTPTDDPEINSIRMALANDSFVLMGGEKTANLASAISKCCTEGSMDSLKELSKATREFSSDESMVSSLSRSVLTSGLQATLGVTTSSVLQQSVPILSYGVAAYDSGVALSNVYSWSSGDTTVSGLETTKSVITALGSVGGSSIAPVIGPLLATGLNLGIDWASSWF